jgi:thiamine transport system ATP-binding protein
MLHVESLRTRHDGRDLFTNLTLHIATGERVALLGPSGSGKTTLLRIIAGLEAAEAGRVVINERDVTNVAPHVRGVGMVFQDNQLFPHLDVAANVGYGEAVHRLPRNERDRVVADMLELVGLQGFAGRDVTTLSGGEAKRVALARALAPRPAVLLLDEPLTGLDVALHDRLLADVRSVLAARRTTTLHVTHDPAEAAAVSDRVVLLADIANVATP